jgi:hypothetical protein
MLKRIAALFLLAAAAPVAAQWLDLKTPDIPRTADGSVDRSAVAPRTAYGRPDLSGIWVPTDFSGSILEQENLQQWALDEIEAHAGNFFANDPRFHCLPSGPGAYPAGAAYAGSRRIVQQPNIIAVLNSDLTYRQIFLDGRELEENPFPTWTGYSVGHWDGDVLVVESNGYNDRTWLHRDGLPHTEALRITERYTRPDFGHMRIDVTYDDPGTFTSTVNGVIEMRFVADSELLEVVCNESSKGTSHYTGTSEEAEQKIVEVDPETLDKYVGTYRGIWLGNLITVAISRDGDELFIERTPPYAETGSAHVGKTPLTAQSQNAFECCGLGFIFTNEQNGVTTEVLEVHVSGAWTFERVP